MEVYFSRNKTEPTIREQCHRDRKPGDILILQACNYSKRYGVLSAVLHTLRLGKKTKKTTRPTSSSSSASKRKKEEEEIVSGWYQIRIEDGFVGREGMDKVMEVILKECTVDRLSVGDDRRQLLKQHPSTACRPLFRFMPFNDSLTELRMSDIIINCDKVMILERSFADSNSQSSSTSHGRSQRSKSQNQESICRIRELSFYSCTFLEGAQESLGNTIRRHMIPSLKRLSLSNRVHEPCDDLTASGLLSPVLLSDADYYYGDMATAAANRSSFLEELKVAVDWSHSRVPKLMSVVAKWLRQGQPKEENKEVQSTEETAAINNSNDRRAVTSAHSAAASKTYATVPRSLSLFGKSMSDEDRDDRDDDYGQSQAFTHFGDEALDSIRCCRTLKRMSIYFGRRMSLREFDKFLHHSILPHFSSSHGGQIQYLNLTECDFSIHNREATAVSFFNSIGKDDEDNDNDNDEGNRPLSLLSELRLEDCRLTNKCMKALSSRLRFLKRLRRLDLGGYQLFTERCVRKNFVPALKPTVHLEVIIITVDTFVTQGLIQFHCDINQAGRRYLLKQQRPKELEYQKEEEDDDDDDDIGNNNNNNNNNHHENRNNSKKSSSVGYPVALWPLILSRCGTYKMPLTTLVLATEYAHYKELRSNRIPYFSESSASIRRRMEIEKEREANEDEDDNTDDNDNNDDDNVRAEYYKSLAEKSYEDEDESERYKRGSLSTVRAEYYKSLAEKSYEDEDEYDCYRRGSLHTVDVRVASAMYYLLLNGALVECCSCRLATSSTPPTSTKTTSRTETETMTTTTTTTKVRSSPRKKAKTVK